MMATSQKLRVQDVPTSLRANDLFGKYKREPSQTVREVDI